MQYTEYINAAKRHIDTCEKLLNLASDPTINKEIRENLLKNMYYLVGYIYECSIKYAYFSYHYDRSFKTIKNPKPHIKDKKDVEWLADFGKLDDYKVHFPFLDHKEIEENKKLRSNGEAFTWKKNPKTLSYLQINKFRSTTDVFNHLNNLLSNLNMLLEEDFGQSSIQKIVDIIKWQVDSRYSNAINLQDLSIMREIFKDVQTLFGEIKIFEKRLKYRKQ